MENFTIELDADGIALITFDVPGRSINTITENVIAELRDLTAYLKTNADVKGAVLCSGKPNAFCAGADLGEMGGHQNADADAAPDDEFLRREFETLHGISRVFREFEANGKPIAAAIEGLALGGGLEWLLDCHYRVIADQPKLRIGLPESTLGLLPGGGGTQRLPRLIGIEAALALLLQGRSVGPREALELGIVHEIAPPGEVVQAAKAWVKTKGDALQPWEKPGFVIPGGGLDAEGGLALQLASAEIDKKYHGNYPAYLNILKSVSEGVQLPIDAALRIESWCMVRTVNSRQAKAMLRTLFLSQQAVSKGLGRPAGLPKSELKKVVLVGPCKIGAGLALEQASAGIETVLLVSTDAIPALRQLLQDEGAKLRLTDEKLLQLMARITLGPDPALAHGSDLVIHDVPEAAIAPGSEIFADAAQVRLVSGRPDFDAGRPAGFHATLNFMQPRMAPVEVIKGDRMTDPCLAKIVDYIVKLRKVPIVVSDVAGGYVGRIARAYADEGQRMLAEGISPILVENAGISASMAKGPLGAAEWQPAGAMLVTEADGLALIDELRSRLLFRQSIEAVRCREDGTVADARIADVGAILGCGFASWTGGPLSYVDMLGVRNFVERCNDLSEKYGSRFAPPQLVLRMQAAGKSFY